MTFDAKPWVEIVAALTIPLSIFMIVWNRTKTGKGMGAKSLRFLAAGVVIPTLVILALEGKLDAGPISAMLGAIIGYVFGQSSKEE